MLVPTLIALPACSGGKPQDASTKPSSHTVAPLLSSSKPTASATPAPSPSTPSGRFTIAFAGDVHFADRTATRLAANPATAFGVSAAVLSKADLTMVNLETAVAVGGRAENKTFTFEAPPTAFTALADAGIDVATMANNHGADFGSAGLVQTLSAIGTSHFPVIGIGANAAAAYAPYYKTINGVRLALVAASQVQDETLAHFSATDTSGGIANAYSDRLIASVRAAKAKSDLVIVYVHWGTEYQTCPNSDQRRLADALSAAGADAIVGTHAHVLQGAGWRPDGKYVAYGLGNYFWWRSFGNNQDDNGVLTLSIRNKRIASADFAPSHLDERGIGLPVTGATRQRILTEWEQARQCADLLPKPPTS
jgi:poly-gamma-glutamate capsule biosynthesis protein CapA/YwtB (metallophosphatase superfamily)